MLNADVNNIEFTIIDTETTGLFLKDGAKLVEVAGVKMYGKNLDLSSSYEKLINPKLKIPHSAYKIHGISDSMVENSPNIDEVIPDFMRFIGRSIVVGHNIRFDIQFIKQAIENSGIKHQSIGYLDSIAILKQTYPGLKSYSLDYLIKAFSINTNILPVARHRALFDSMCTGILLQDCFSKLGNNCLETVDKFTKLF